MGTAQMAGKKDERSEASRAIAKAILEQYKPTTTEEMQRAPDPFLKMLSSSAALST